MGGKGRPSSIEGKGFCVPGSEKCKWNKWNKPLRAIAYAPSLCMLDSVIEVQYIRPSWILELPKPNFGKRGEIGGGSSSKQIRDLLTSSAD